MKNKISGEYYKKRSEASQYLLSEITNKLDDVGECQLNHLYLKINLEFGFSKKFVDEFVNILKKSHNLEEIDGTIFRA